MMRITPYLKIAIFIYDIKIYITNGTTIVNLVLMLKSFLV